MLGKIIPEKPSNRPKKKPSGTRPRGPSGPKRLAKTRIILKIIAALAAVGFIIGFFLVLIYGHDLPDIDKLYDDKLQQSIMILDYKGEPVNTYGDYFTEFVQYKEMPKSLIDAVVATEDRRFFEHWGLDIRGMARAMAMNIIHGKLQQGGSTITQQLAKNVFLKPERKLKRKVQEAMLAIWLEHKYSKQQIITMYLNRVYLGSGVYGVDAASRRYFNKSVRKLNLYESALIAGLLKAPSAYAPTNNPKASADRTEQVLLNMVDDDKITQSQMKRALKTGTQVAVRANNPSTKYYTDFVVDQVQNYVGKVPESLVVKTTFRPDLQVLAERTISKTMLEFSDKDNAHQAAMVVMKPSGEVLAMIGGVDYVQSQFNRAVQAERQPGSSFKLFVYTAAMLYGKSPDDIIDDSPFSIGSWTPKNFDGRPHGPVTMREAFAHSYNLAAAHLAQEVGIDNIVFLAKQMGIKSPLMAVPSLALGSSEVNLLELTTAFAHIANNGYSVYPYAIEEIKTQHGDVLYHREEQEQKRVVDEDAVHKMNDLMMHVVTSGTARSAQIGRDVAGKTGTSQDFRDAWFIGFTPQLVTGVWVGNDDNAQMKKITGGSLPARMWAEFMRTALANTPARSISTNYGFSTSVKSGVENFWNSVTGDSAQPKSPDVIEQHTLPPTQQQNPQSPAANGFGTPAGILPQEKPAEQNENGGY